MIKTKTYRFMLTTFINEYSMITVNMVFGCVERNYSIPIPIELNEEYLTPMTEVDPFFEAVKFGLLCSFGYSLICLVEWLLH